MENQPPMETKCKVAELIGFVSKKWILLILHAVHQWADSFSTLEKSVSGINSRMLSERLTEMQTYGIVDRKIVSEKPVKIRYSLTKKGLELALEMDRLNTLARSW